MDTMKSLNDAFAILDKAAKDCRREATAIWLKADHARSYINQQIADLLTDN